MRLWRVIRKLTMWKGYDMNDREEAVFGLVYAEFGKTRTPAALVAAYVRETAAMREEMKASTIEVAAKALRVLYDMEAQS